MITGLLITVPLTAAQANSDWIEHGWKHIQENNIDSAISIWQRGVNTLDNKQLLGSLGSFASLPNALAMLKRAGRNEKAFIIRQPHSGNWRYRLLTAQAIEKNIETRQIRMAALKASLAIKGKLLANEALKFKNSGTGNARPKQTVAKRTPAAVNEEQLIMALDPETFTINSFEVKGNKRISTDIILMSLKDYYGSEKTDSDLKNIRRQVIDTHNLSRIYNIKVKKPILIAEDTVLITITE